MRDWQPAREMPPLDEAERRVLLDGATERPGSGKYDKFFERGIYLCRQCGTPLYRSDDKFDCGCGWPAFDDALPEVVERRPDADGRRTEIVCTNCKGHLGHVFEGERLTPKNTRHCVNALSLSFLPTRQALFAGGCFWGVEDFFAAQEGVVAAVSGYTGGQTKNPTYREVCGGRSGHAEAVLIDFDPNTTDYRTLLRKFFEIHDATQLNRQGPDVGTQYRSTVFYFDDAQRRAAETVVAYLQSQGRRIVTQVLPASAFYPAEDYHQKYFAKNPAKLCHSCHAQRAISWEGLKAEAEA